MARGGHLPAALAAVHPRHRVPHRAELALGTVVAVVAATVDIRAAIGFSSLAVLIYYAIANAAAWTLDRSPAGRLVAALGLAGCLLLAVFLPSASALAGSVVVGIGALVYAATRLRRTGLR